MILLDTNVVSEIFKPAPAEAVRAWLDARRDIDVHLCSPVLAELRYGLERLPPGRRKSHLAAQIARLQTDIFLGRVLPFDEAAATAYGGLVAGCERRGQPISTMDAMIAAVALAHHAVLATRNVRHFAHTGLDLVNPFEAE